MNAAIYARKSTEQTGVSDESKSITRQIDGARAFITKNGWTLDDTQIGTKRVKGPDGKDEDRPVYRHIYEDDGVSGALFADRPSFQRMMADANAKAFDVVTFYDLDRLGRNSRRTMEALNELTDLGIAIYDYSTGVAVDLDSFEGEMITFFKSRSAQQYKDQVRKYTKNASAKKRKPGW